MRLSGLENELLGLHKTSFSSFIRNTFSSFRKITFRLLKKSFSAPKKELLGLNNNKNTSLLKQRRTTEIQFFGLRKKKFLGLVVPKLPATEEGVIWHKPLWEPGRN